MMLFVTLMVIGQIDFEPERRFGVANGMTDFVCADLDGQNGPDIIAAGTTDQALILLWNRGVVDGIWRGFTPPQQIPAQDIPLALGVCDVDRDGDLDIVAGTPTGITRWLNDGNGSLGDEQQFDGGGDSSPVRLLCMVSGFPDIVRLDGGGWTVFQNRTDGTFVVTSRVGRGIKEARLCDIDGDGSDDILHMISNDDAFAVSLSIGRGLFAPPVRYIGSGGGGGSRTLACGDLDGDGAIDVLTGRLTRFRGRFDGTLVPGGPISDGFSGVATQLVIVDIDSDGDGDVITTTTRLGLGVFTNDGAGNFGFPAAFDTSGQSILRTCDIDGDGDTDIIVGNIIQISVLLNTARHPELIPGDADGDGDVDLADYMVLEACLTDPGRASFFAECDTFDFDSDNDVDLSDLIAFQAAFTGAR